MTSADFRWIFFSPQVEGWAWLEMGVSLPCRYSGSEGSPRGRGWAISFTCGHALLRRSGLQWVPKQLPSPSSCRELARILLQSENPAEVLEIKLRGACRGGPPETGPLTLSLGDSSALSPSAWSAAVQGSLPPTAPGGGLGS